MPNPRKSWESTETEPDWGDSNENFDEIYEKNNEESDLGDIQQQHGSVLMHLLSQVAYLRRNNFLSLKRSKLIRALLNKRHITSHVSLTLIG